jgi:hypothetical protein
MFQKVADSTMLSPQSAEAKPTTDKRRSRVSMASSAASRGFMSGREISETFSSKVYEMKWCLFSIAANIGLLLFFQHLADGIIVDFAQDSIIKTAGVVCIVILLVSNVVTLKAMDQGFQAYFGNIFCSKGTSMAVCGFAQASTLSKYTYANELSLNSTVRKMLVRLSYVWIVAEIMKVLTPIPATALLHKPLHVDLGTTNCIEFTQEGLPVDRNWPTMEVESGVAELIFGNSIGYLRSQLTDPMNATKAIIGPQLLGAVNDGDTIVGKGFVADIVTSCQCVENGTQTEFINLGLPVGMATETAREVADKTVKAFGLAMVNSIEKFDDAINITSVLINTPVCGGLNTLIYPVCKTTISNHQHAVIEMLYMTDGTPASIAQEHATVREVQGFANIKNWMGQALENIFQGEVAAYEFPATVPAMLNPLFFWTSSNLVSVNPALLEAGMETFYTIILRASIQRSYATKGAFCIRNIVVEDQSVLAVDSYGLQGAYAILSIQLIFSILALSAFVPWILNSAPAGPGIRAVREGPYFTTLLADSNFSDNIRGLCNAPTFAIWQGLDVRVRVGEAVETMDDEVGHIVMDKAKMVRQLVNGRKYY